MSDIIAADQLRLLIERIERLEEEKKGISDDIKDVKAEAKGQGFDVATINAIIKLRKMDIESRREAEALLDTYKAALGMLDGTPLGNWAVEKITKAKAAPAVAEGETPPVIEQEPVEPAPPETTVEDARAMGAEAAASGAAVTANPFPARDARRAAWDEAWCAALGSDGMDIPDALKPTAKPKKGDEPKAGGK
jgi:uncharacterized protein (UPF0335 family)